MPDILMASRANPSLDPIAHAAAWLDDYCARAPTHDVVRSAGAAAWRVVLEELAATSAGDLGRARERLQVAGAEAPPVSPLPLLLPADEWAGIAAGVAERAELLERVVADLYGAQALVADGALPAALVAGSPLFLRPMVGLVPPGGRHLHFVAFDLARGPTGAWCVLADHLRAPTGAGDALANRLAVSRALAGSQDRLHVRRHAPFLSAFRAGLAALCRRSDPRIGLLTAGRRDPAYPEQALLARDLGMLLVEGADLAALEGKIYVRTIAGLKRIDALWRRLDPRLLDPLAFDTHSRVGVPGLVDAYAAGEVVIANAPGAGVAEARAFAAFLPALAERLLGAPLALPNIATWWCGGERERTHVAANLDRLTVAPAFGHRPLGLADGASRADLLADLARRPQDYVGQEEVRLSTMPAVAGNRLEPRPFTLRVFAARDAGGGWAVMPGGLARIGDASATSWPAFGDGGWSADVAVHGTGPVVAPPLAATAVRVRRNPGTLPSRVADNVYWLGRYLERGEALLGAVRVLLGHSIDADGGGPAPATVARLVGMIAGAGAAPPAATPRASPAAFARAALEDGHGHGVAAIDRHVRALGDALRERLSVDMLRLLDAPAPAETGLMERADALQRRYAAIAGLAAEHVVRNDEWRFHDLGRRIERAAAAARHVRLFGMTGAGDDDLSSLLDLADSQISYRQRYPGGLARAGVVDLVALDPGNPRSLAFQTERIARHLARLPVLGGDGIAEPQQAQALALQAVVATADAATLDADALGDVERRLAALSDAVARRYFLQGAEPLRAAELTLG